MLFGPWLAHQTEKLPVIGWDQIGIHSIVSLMSWSTQNPLQSKTKYGTYDVWK